LNISLSSGVTNRLEYRTREVDGRMEYISKKYNSVLVLSLDRLCGLVVRVSWLKIQMFRVGFPAVPDFLRSSGSGTGSTQPREDN
jgi:hypothetical protein